MVACDTHRVRRALRKPLDDLLPLIWGEFSLELGQATKDVSIGCRGASLYPPVCH
jgi:hypothetical protein